MLSNTEMREILNSWKNQVFPACAKHFPVCLLAELALIPDNRIREFRKGANCLGRMRLMRLSNAIMKIKAGEYTFRAEPKGNAWRYILIQVPENERKPLFTGRIQFQGGASKMVLKQENKPKSMPNFMDVFTKPVIPALPTTFKVAK